ncbi:glycosyltransferase family 39 protein [Aetokthonos hydrillicola Thurmond2011]|jgi:4-amino-4-deoxy-L-arabinose transferase-like glycosyltransferase|uniref:Glycosyltransferase family 39 protein n=1 Tax=Aetokthonos hydrillicola Thurmond2011 TaxID=2712845 RepID=A0AAP5MA77_9CYAN|nr:glycosyltransferase family 39 protein [Aetokthonos hydrillicola]MBO3459121.1 glycosyltransferase family 39 protein [Aetokthonos hydrillicola CCALA 1050]MBW4584705.1 glycosyltransferase family 39 protein [Aetokthonos hydrillicola CCALA 1050]MDR9895249.1 glycosyltransferase family 39 protein [Aetokthonos hydrillicola Thurmond2011]
MQEESFIWSPLRKRYRRVEKRIDRLWILGLLFAAVLIFTFNLGGLALRDWDEGTVAQVAREIWRAPAGSMRWLYPTLEGEPYHNKPPLMHLLISWSYSLGGVNEWTSRLPGALLTAISVPLLYCIAREIFRRRSAAIYSALVYLTMLPVIRHGRLAMLDGAVVCFFMIMMLCVLRSRRDLRYCLGIGIGFGLICLTKSILGVLLGTIALIFLFWDTPRLLTSWYMWSAILIGSVPVAFWYYAQWLHYGQVSTSIGVVDQSLSRVWNSVEGHKGPPWYYLLEILKYTWPWLIFLPESLRLTWENKNLSWAKLVLVWSVVYLVVVSCMETKLPWYIFPIYPSLALAIGAKLSEIDTSPTVSSYPRFWVVSLALIAVVASGGGIYFSWAQQPKPDLILIAASLAVTMVLATVLAQRDDKQFLKILLWGSYISLLLFVKSNYWVWELGEAYPVKPVAAMIEHAKPQGKIYTSFPYRRPSLNFYSDRVVIPASIDELQKYWASNEQLYFLLDETALKNLQLKHIQPIDQASGWTFLTKGTGHGG